MPTLSIDIETYSSNDIKSGGVYRYVDAEDFTVLMFAYSIDGDPVEIIDLTVESLPMVLVDMLASPDYTKTAYNAAFERLCLSKYLNTELPIDQWDCTMVRAARCGWPMGLDACAKAMGLQQEKDKAGAALIRYFSIPCKPTKANGGRTRNMPENALPKWEDFLDYCKQDVVVEMAIRNRVLSMPVTEKEQQLYWLDQKINDNGVQVDLTLVNNAIDIHEKYKDRLTTEAADITGLSNPNSAAQLKTWLNGQDGVYVDTLTKSDVKELIRGTDGDVKRVLEIRSEAAKTSVKKYAAMLSAVCGDRRVHGLLQFYGANRTGRWAGRLVQVQNLPRNYLKDLDLARGLVVDGDGELLEMLYGNVPDTLSQLIRTSFVAGKGKRLIVADFSAIEARVIAWLAGERWRLDVFNTHGMIYEASAAAMFHVSIDSILTKTKIDGKSVKIEGPNYELRAKGKVAELALGYQGGPGALIAMGALYMGLSETELPDIVQRWRKENPAIVQLWKRVESAAYEAVSNPGMTINMNNGLKFKMTGGYLLIKLHSGRTLSYVQPRIVQKDFGKGIVYQGMDQTTRQWKTQDTYGGKLVENIVQAIARDCLAEAMLNLDAAGHKIVFHVHDECIIETADDTVSVREIEALMGAPLDWAPGLPLRADGYETYYYKKD